MNNNITDMLNPLKKEKITKTQKTVVIITIIVVTAIILTPFVRAAFLSAGHRKGVAVSNGYYFTSNVLTKMDNSESTPGSYMCVCSSNSTTLDIRIMNYNSYLVANPYDITYSIKYQLVNYGTNSDKYTYSLRYNGVSNEIQQTEATISDIYLQGNQLSNTDFTVTVNKVDVTAAISDAATIRIIAVPSQPTVMNQLYIGSDVSLSSGNTEFAAIGGFVLSDENTIDNYSGFLYNVSTSGNIPAGHIGEIELTWDYNELEIDVLNEYYISGTLTTDDVTHSKSLKIDVDTGEYLSFAFFRAPTWGHGDNNFSPHDEPNYDNCFNMQYRTKNLL